MLSSAREAVALLEPGIVPDLRDQAEKLLAEVSSEQKLAENEARSAAADRRLLDRLVAIRSARIDDNYGTATNEAYAEALREAGYEPDAADPTASVAKIRARPAAVLSGITEALDHWTRVRKDLLQDLPGAKRLARVANESDPDVWRQSHRKTLEIPEKQPRLVALQALAESVPSGILGPASLDGLAAALSSAGDLSRAESVLREAQRRHPQDFWVNFDLAEILTRLGRREEALRYYVAARSIRPVSAFQLGDALSLKGETEEAIAIYQDLARLQPENGQNLSKLTDVLT